MAFKEGVAAPDGGGHKPTKVITSHPSGVTPIPRMRHNSKDGVVRTPHPETAQGWFPNADVRQVEQ